MKKFLAAALSIAMVLSLAACGQQAAAPAPAATEAATQAAAPAATQAAAAPAATEAPKTEAAAPAAPEKVYNWSLSTTYGTGTLIVEFFNRFADLAKEYTNGAINITVYPDATIAGEDDAMAQVASGELEMTATGTFAWKNYSPQYYWVAAPFFITEATVWERMSNESDLAQEQKKIWAEQYNTYALGDCMFRGYRNLVCKKKISNVNDIKGVKVRMNTDPLWNAIWQSFGATTVPVALTELYTALQTGVAEGCENPLSESGSLNVPEVVDYVMASNHMCDCTSIYMSYSAYQELSPELQEALTKAEKDAVAEYRPKVDDDMQKWIDVYKAAGCEYVADFDAQSFKDAAAPVYKEYFEKEWTGMSYDDALALLAQYE